MRKGQSTARHKPAPMMMAMPTTFEQLQLDVPKLKDRLKLPPWLEFLFVEDRKDQAALTDIEKERFICAVNTLIANGTYGNLVAIHADMSHMMHGTQRFLPWHRVYLLQLEQSDLGDPSGRNHSVLGLDQGGRGSHSTVAGIVHANRPHADRAADFRYPLAENASGSCYARVEHPHYHERRKFRELLATARECPWRRTWLRPHSTSRSYLLDASRQHRPPVGRLAESTPRYRSGSRRGRTVDSHGSLIHDRTANARHRSTGVRIRLKTRLRPARPTSAQEAAHPRGPLSQASPVHMNRAELSKRRMRALRGQAGC